MDAGAGTTARRDAGFWIELIVGLAPATLIIAPRLLHWGWLFGYGLWLRISRLVAFSPGVIGSLALSAYFLAWDLAALFAVICLWVAVLDDPERLRRRRVARGVVIAGLGTGFLASIQFAVRPLAGVSFARQPWLLLSIAGPLAVAARRIWVLTRRRNSHSSDTGALPN